jgi:hypothetical protein
VRRIKTENYTLYRSRPAGAAKIDT